jgi:DNA-binding beta-propeller fold protein YncE
LSLAVSPDGKRVFVIGRSRGSSLKADYATIAYDVATGTRLWVSRYNGPGNGVDYATKVVVSPDGTRVYVTGSAYSGTADLRDYATVAYDAATGNQLWASIYEAGTCCRGGATAMAISPDGKTVYVTGNTSAGLDISGFGTVAYDAATGAQLWASLYNAPDASASATAINLSPDGKALFVTGTSAAVAAPDQGDTVAYDAATGAQLWTSMAAARGISTPSRMPLRPARSYGRSKAQLVGPSP